jgi:hypothetical protein
MLNQRLDEHLSKDELLQALVDMGDLTTKRQSHLRYCADCQKDLERLHQSFVRLEKVARQMTPAMSRTFRLPQKAVTHRWWRFGPMWATGVAAAMILAFALWWPQQLDRSAPVPNVARQNAVASDSLLDEVDALVDNALPPVLLQLTASSDPDDSQSVIDWVVPPIDELNDDNSWT